VVSHKKANNTQIADLFYAADVVVDRILPRLAIKTYNYLDLSILIYAVSMIILYVGVYWQTRIVNE